MKFGLFQIVSPFAKNADLAGPFATLHVTFAFSLLGLIALHIAAALFHHFVKRDAVLRRMLPRPSDA